MVIVVGFLVVGIVIGIAAFFVTREATRIAHEPPPALYHLDDALARLVEHLPDDIAATLTVDDVRRILEAQVDFFKRKGVSSNGSTAYPAGTRRRAMKGAGHSFFSSSGVADPWL